MNNETIKKIALENGFKLKKQPDGSDDLNPYVYDFAKAIAANAIANIDVVELVSIGLRHADVEGFAYQDMQDALNHASAKALRGLV